MNPLRCEISIRFEHLKSATKKFGFLQLDVLLDPEKDTLIKTQIKLTAL